MENVYSRNSTIESGIRRNQEAVELRAVSLVVTDRDSIMRNMMLVSIWPAVLRRELAQRCKLLGAYELPELIGAQGLVA